jgi:hypothetical protein
MARHFDNRANLSDMVNCINIFTCELPPKIKCQWDSHKELHILSQSMTSNPQVTVLHAKLLDKVAEQETDITGVLVSRVYIACYLDVFKLL